MHGRPTVRRSLHAADHHDERQVACRSGGKELENLSVDEARALHGRDDVVFVDIRDIRELQRDGKIPGAFHCPRGMVEFWIDPESPYHKDRASGEQDCE